MGAAATAWLAGAVAVSASGFSAACAAEDDWLGAREKSYLVPALDIFGFDFLVNRFNHYVGDDPTAEVTLSSLKDNLQGPWVTDNDPFQVNQLGHPYQGSMYHGFARSAGLDYWESLGYTFAGSLMWETAGETTAPSKNDQIATGLGGTFLGEPLFRMANLLLENADGEPGFWRELGAAAISPATGFNRLAFDRFDRVYPSRDAHYYSRLQVGMNATVQDVSGSTTQLDSWEGSANFSMDYGLPGKAGYSYDRPFDYFTFQVTTSTATSSAFENIVSQGLLYGDRYHIGPSYRGVWGLYGSYDYLSPQIFRISSTAVALGTTGQWWLTDAVVLRGSALLGTGYAAVGTIHGTGEDRFHYGITPQASLEMRLIYRERMSFDVAARDYFVTDVASADTIGHDNIARVEATATWRIHRHHAIALKYIWSHRDASFSGGNDFTQTRGTIGLFYTLLGADNFGSLDWRGDAVASR
jgi:uncharacterized protein DUF3943